MAAEQGHVGVARLLLDHGADVTATTHEGATALHWAAFHDHVEVAALLMSHGAPLDVRDSSGKTAAALALEKSQDGQHSDVLELLKGLARHDRERKSKQDL